MATSTVGALPASVNLVTYGGDDFWVNVQVLSSTGQPVDLTPFTPEAQIRLAPHSPILYGEFIITSPTADILKLYLPGSLSADLPTRCAWDLQLTDADGIVMTLAAGTLVVEPEVTR